MRCPKCNFDNPPEAVFCNKCATQLSFESQASFTQTLDMTPYKFTRGMTFAGRYEIIEELATGGMGAVYRAFDKKIEEEVALKLIKPEIAAEKKTIERFRNELKITRKIRHNNVCQMYDLHEENGILFITMEYVRGEDLKSFIRRSKQLTVATALSIAKQVAEGLSEAHKLGVVHRDLKPQNIMIDKQGSAKIMDFGIAHSLQGKGLTGEGAIIGTPEYMSPEQIEGRATDQRADIYALGVILFEMLTGRVPFEGETVFAIANKHKNEPPPVPKKIVPGMPEDLSRLILCCMEKDKAKRYKTANDLIFDLASIEQSLPSSERILLKPRSLTSREITVKFTPKKLILPVASLVLVAAIVFSLLKFLPKKETQTPQAFVTTLAVLPFTDLSLEKDQDSWCEGIAETILSALANVTNLQVRGRHSSFQFNAQDDPQEVGRKLNVEKLLMGSLQKAGNKLRITVQLVSTADGMTLWSEKLDGEMEEIFDIQDRIASMTINKMNIELQEGEKTRLVKRYTNSKEAYDFYLKGKHISRLNTVDAILKAISNYLEAVKVDPGFVLPYIELAHWYMHLYVSLGHGTKDDAYSKSKEALTRAFAIDSENGEAYAVLADLNYCFENDVIAAEQNYQHAFRLSPKSMIVLRLHNGFLTERGRLNEALSGIKLLTELDPLRVFNYFSLGRIYYFLRRYDESVSAYQMGLELDPDFLPIQYWSLFTYLAQGNYQKAQETALWFEHRYPRMYLRAIALIEISSGNRAEAEKHKESARDLFKGPFAEAIYYAALGERYQALENLTKLYNENWGSLSFCFLVHFFDKYRSDPEFVALLEKSGFQF